MGCEGQEGRRSEVAERTTRSRCTGASRGRGMSEAAVEAEQGGGEDSVEAPVAPLPSIFALTSEEAAGSAPGAALQPAGQLAAQLSEAVPELESTRQPTASAEAPTPEAPEAPEAAPAPGSDPPTEESALAPEPEPDPQLVLAPEAVAQSYPEPVPEPEPAALIETDQDRDRRDAREMMQRRYSQQGSPAPLRSDSRGLSMTLDSLLTYKLQVRASVLPGSLVATALPLHPPSGSVARVRPWNNFSRRCPIYINFAWGAGSCTGQDGVPPQPVQTCERKDQRERGSDSLRSSQA